MGVRYRNHHCELSAEHQPIQGRHACWRELQSERCEWFAIRGNGGGWRQRGMDIFLRAGDESCPSAHRRNGGRDACRCLCLPLAVTDSIMKAYRESQRAHPQANKQNGARLWHRGRRVRQSEINGIIKSANNAKFDPYSVVEVCGKAASKGLKGDTFSGSATDRERPFVRVEKPFTINSESAWVNVS